MSDLTKILDKVKFHFQRYKAGERIFSRGDVCNSLVFVFAGSILSERTLPAERYTFGEVFRAPCLIEPYSLFGLHQNFVFSYTAHTDANLITIDKHFFTQELNNYETFRINYINMLSNGNQRLFDGWGKLPNGEVEKRVADFLFLLSTQPFGEKLVRAKMEDLAQVLNTTRLKLSKVLNDMAQRGQIDLMRMGFRVYALEKLRSE